MKNLLNIKCYEWKSQNINQKAEDIFNLHEKLSVNWLVKIVSTIVIQGGDMCENKWQFRYLQSIIPYEVKINITKYNKHNYIQVMTKCNELCLWKKYQSVRHGIKTIDNGINNACVTFNFLHKTKLSPMKRSQMLNFSECWSI